MPAEITQDADLKPTDPPADQAVVVDPPKGDEPADAGAPKQGEDAAPKTALEAAKAVMAKGAKDAADEAKPQTGEPPTAKTEKKVDVEFDDPSLPFKDHPSWKKWSSEHRILKVAKEKNEQAIAQMEPRVKAHDALLNFFDTNGLKQEDVAQGLSIMAAVRNDPARAYELLAPIVEGLRVAVGEAIPPDIQQRIEAGLIDEASGRELAKQRAAADLAKQESARYAERQQREREERDRGEQERGVSEIEKSLNAWHEDWKGRDPDVAKKQPLLEPMLEAAWARNPPRTADEARRQADEVLAALEQKMQVFRPTREAKGGHLPVGGASTTHAAQVPTSSLEAAKMALHR